MLALLQLTVFIQMAWDDMLDAESTAWKHAMDTDIN